MSLPPSCSRILPGVLPVATRREKGRTGHRLRGEMLSSLTGDRWSLLHVWVVLVGDARLPSIAWEQPGSCGRPDRSCSQLLTAAFRVCARACACVHGCAYMCTCMPVYARVCFVCICMHVWGHMHLCACVCTHVCVCAHEHAHRFTKALVISRRALRSAKTHNGFQTFDIKMFSNHLPLAEPGKAGLWCEAQS